MHHLDRLDASRHDPREDAGVGKADFAEVWVSPRLGGFPVQNVLQQAEVLSAEWAV